MLTCTIVISGVLDSRFGDRFPGLVATATGANTELRGELIDQAEVKGVLNQLYDLGIEVLAFTAMPAGDPAAG